MNLNQHNLKMQIDTGGADSIICELTDQKLWTESPPTLQLYDIKLRTYTGEQTKVLCSLYIIAKYAGTRSAPSLWWLEKVPHSLAETNSTNFN